MTPEDISQAAKLALADAELRSALGEETYCPVSFTGKLLQRWILRGLRRSDVIACVSQATREDAERLVSGNGPSPKLEMIHNGLNHLGANPYFYRLVGGAVIFVAMYADALKAGSRGAARDVESA